MKTASLLSLALSVCLLGSLPAVVCESTNEKSEAQHGNLRRVTPSLGDVQVGRSLQDECIPSITFTGNTLGQATLGSPGPSQSCNANSDCPVGPQGQAPCCVADYCLCEAFGIGGSCLSPTEAGIVETPSPTEPATAAPETPSPTEPPSAAPATPSPTEPPSSNGCVRTINDELANYLFANGWESCKSNADCPVTGCCRQWYCMCDLSSTGLCDGYD